MLVGGEETDEEGAAATKKPRAHERGRLRDPRAREGTLFLFFLAPEEVG
jgi:hypothetical protein